MLMKGLSDSEYFEQFDIRRLSVGSYTYKI